MELSTQRPDSRWPAWLRGAGCVWEEGGSKGEVRRCKSKRAGKGGTRLLFIGKIQGQGKGAALASRTTKCWKTRHMGHLRELDHTPNSGQLQSARALGSAFAA